jgi:hypothetical protein
VFENRVLRRIFGPRRDEVTGDWRKLHNEEIHNLNSSPNIIRMINSRRMRWAGRVARMGAKRNANRILVGRPEGKRPLGRPRRRRVYNIKIDLRDIEWDGMNWIELAQDRDQWRALVNMVPENCWEVLGRLNKWPLLKKGSAAKVSKLKKRQSCLCALLIKHYAMKAYGVVDV